MDKRRWIPALVVGLLLLSACTAPQANVPVEIAPSPSATQALPVQAEDGPVTVYYPEGASEDTAAYGVTYSLPDFSQRGTAGEVMEASLQTWRLELFNRVETERLPLADRIEGGELPATVVTYTCTEVETPLGAYTNVVFWEDCWFESSEAKESRVSTLVFDDAGQECSLASASGVYDPLPIAAQQVWNITSQNPAAYYGDLTPEDVAEALDLYNGFTVAEEGYTLYVQPGLLAADESNGAPLEFSFGRNALYPDFVGSLMDPEAYEALLPQMFALATHCGPGFLSWTAQEGLPTVDAYTYGVKVNDALESEEGLTLRGMLMKGLPGEGDAAEIANVTLALTQDAAGGWSIQSFAVA